MSRIIKCRGWDKKDAKWVYVELTTGEAEYDFEGDFNWHDLEPWQEFTGLHDKNGKEIYEGDIIRGVNGYGDVHVWPVVWDTFTEEETGFNVGFRDDRKCEIIGNIFENPELISGNANV